MPRKKANCLNETRIMKNGMKATCINYRLSKDIDVQFEDGTIVEHVQKVHFYNGTITNPNSKYNPYTKLKSLYDTNPELINEWDYERNTISPKEITRSYNKNVWWKCVLGHSWEARVTSRTRKKSTGCPYCSGNLALSGFNDFATLNPELMLDWDFNKNQNVDPNKITAHSGIYVDWKCHFCGHEWRTRANNRSSAKRGCPNCSMKSTSFGEQAVYYYVKKFFPDSINRYRNGKFELDIFIPSIKFAIEFDGIYFHFDKESQLREKRKYLKCQELGIKLIRIKDSAGISDILYADNIISIENLKSNESLNKIISTLLKDLIDISNYHTASKNIETENPIDKLVNVDRDYFDIVSNKYLREEAESFVNLNPDLLKDWDYELNKTINPKSLTKGSGLKINWKCHVCGYKWKARIPDRLENKCCPCCNRNILVSGVNDFATLYPDELNEWDYNENTMTPNKVLSFNQKVSWICSECGHKWIATINDKVIRKNKTGCPNCANKARSIKRHQRAMKNGGLFQKYPELLNQWNYDKNKNIDINDIAPGSPTKYWWKCDKCGYEWQSSPNNRTHANRVRSCPKCRYKK